MTETNMTTYDNILDIIIRRQGELDISNLRIVNMNKLTELAYKGGESLSQIPSDDFVECMKSVPAKFNKMKELWGNGDE